MRMSELSKESGVPIATIKFYLREGLLAAGMPTARNQARYDDSHLSRLRLIRILTGIGQLSLASVREVLTAIDNKGLSVQGLCKVVNRALFTEQLTPEETSDGGSTRTRVNEFVDGLGWLVEANDPGRGTLTHVLIALRKLGCDVDVKVLEPYAEAAIDQATREAELVRADANGAAIDSTTLVARTVLFEVAFVAMRRMAQDYYLSQRFAGTDQAS
jgi:DNA-binding transcriptional MerR regulator